MRATLTALLLLAGGCAKSNTKQCGVITCGPDTVCSPNNDRCVTQTQLDACDNSTNGDGCSVPGISVGVCNDGVCLGAGCGNGIQEDDADERCDDGNNISGDGCRADCKSLEICGDGVLDFTGPVPETCDCGTDPDKLPLGCSEINSDGATASCRSTCKLKRCGDGIVDLGEACDDGNNVPGDGCRADCQGRWTLMQSGTLAVLRDVAAVSSNDAWVVGENKILHWDGTSWASVPPPAAQYDYTDVYVRAPDDVFVLGYSLVGSSNGVYRRFQGTWTTVTPTIVGGGANQGWRAFGGYGSEVYVVGQDGSNAYSAQFNGTSFSNAVFLAAATSAYSYDVLPDGTELATSSNVLRKAPGGVWVDTQVKGTRVVAASPTSVWALGGNGSSHSTDGGATWTPLPVSAELQNFTGGHASTDVAVLVGLEGQALTCTPSLCTISPTGTTTQFFSAFAIDSTHAFIVGTGGTILY